MSIVEVAAHHGVGVEPVLGRRGACELLAHVQIQVVDVLRLLYVINTYPKVSHSFIRREIHELERRGHVITRVSIRKDRSIVDSGDLQEQRKTLHLLEASWLKLCFIAMLSCITRPCRVWQIFRAAASLGIQEGRILRRTVCLIEALNVWNVVRREHIQHVHSHFGTNSAEVGWYTSMLLGVPFSFTVHGPDELNYAGLRQRVEHAKFVVAVSCFGKSQIMRRVGPCYWSKIHVVRCGLAASYFDSRAFPLGSSRRQVVCVARMEIEKGHPVLLRAVAEAKSKGLRLILKLIGDGEMRRELEEMVRNLGISEDVTFLGARTEDDVRKLISDSSALILPSLSENLPIVIMEAFAQARPVIATWVGGVPELVKDGESGWLVPPGSVSAMTGALALLVEAENKRLTHMGVVGQSVARRHHALCGSVDVLSQLFAVGRQ